MDWFAGPKSSPTQPTLAIIFESGKLQLSRSQYDKKPFICDTKLKNSNMKWSGDGTMLAICGMQRLEVEKDGKKEEKDCCILQIWSLDGEL